MELKSPSIQNSGPICDMDMNLGTTHSGEVIFSLHDSQPQDRGVEASFSKTTWNKTLEFGGVSSSNDLTRYKMESFYFYLI
jgi:hypothetical protein